MRCCIVFPVCTVSALMQGEKGGFIFTVVFGHGKEVSCALGLYGLLVAGTVPGTWDVALVLPSWG